MNISDNKVTELEIDDLFKDPSDSQSGDGDSGEPEENLTKTMSQRINTVRAKAEKETQDKVAKEMGYKSYEAMKEAQDKKLILEHGYDPEDIEKVIEPIIKKRIEDDPRFKELEALKQRNQEVYLEKQIASINEATGQQLKASDLSEKVLELWGKGIELEQAYYAVHGKEVVSSIASKVQGGSLAHLATGTSHKGVKKRMLTREEKAMWKSLHPEISDEELSKKTTEIE